MERPTMTPFEYSKVVCVRARQIAEGSRPLVEFFGRFDPVAIAKREVVVGASPMEIVRGRGRWKVGEMNVRDR